jgi:acetyl esterase
MLLQRRQGRMATVDTDATGLHPEARDLLAQFERDGVRPYDQLSVLEARALVAGSTRLQGPRPAVGSVRDVLAPGDPVAGSAWRIPVRIYHPTPERALPLAVYLHGGGFVTGSVAVADRPCRTLAAASGCVVASVEYRLAPESPYPGPVSDCLAAVRWLAAQSAALGGDGGRVTLVGDSAGGALVASCVRALRDAGEPIVDHQVLVYPTLAPPRGRESDSLRNNGEGYGLTRGSLDWFWDHYLATPEDRSDPGAVPLVSGDLARLPRATVVVAQFDPLRDEGLDYAARLTDAGVTVDLRVIAGAIHGFWWMAGVLSQGAELTDLLASALRPRAGS